METKKCRCRSCDQQIPKGQKQYCNDNCKRRENWLKRLTDSPPSKGWGSKNSQLRLDKAASRYAKRIRRGANCAKYY